MTRKEIKDTVKGISKILEIDPPEVKFAEYWNGVYLEAGLFQGWETIVFNPKYIKSASDINIYVTIAHEVRHTYQMTQLKRMHDGLSYTPEADVWLADSLNGLGDTWQDSKEVDAVLFSHLFIAGILTAGFDVAKMIDVDEMQMIFEGLKNEPWYDFKDIIFYEKTNYIYIGPKDLLPKALKGCKK